MNLHHPVHRWLDEAIRAENEATKRGAALATIVATRGSTPREAGARMIVYADGSTWGTIGGGCGEAEVRQAALDVIDTGRPRLLTIDLNGFFGDELEVCGGRMEVFVEPLGRAKACAGAALRQPTDRARQLEEPAPGARRATI